MSDEVREVQISNKGVTLKGTAYDDFRPVIRSGVAMAEDIIEVLRNVVGIPADGLNHYLRHFRERFKARLESVPVENRQSPPFRIGCNVLKEVVSSAEEPELQELFAELLASASDSSTVGNVHPGFANVIGQMTPLDAKILRHMTTKQGPLLSYQSFYSYRLAEDFREYEEESIQTSLDNLVRLGLIEWKIKGVTSNDLTSFRLSMRNSPSPGFGFSSRGSETEIKDLRRTLDSMTNSMNQMLRDIGQKSQVRATTFGKCFALACIQPLPPTTKRSKPVPSEAAVETTEVEDAQA